MATDPKNPFLALKPAQQEGGLKPASDENPFASLGQPQRIEAPDRPEEPEGPGPVRRFMDTLTKRPEVHEGTKRRAVEEFRYNQNQAGTAGITDVGGVAVLPEAPPRVATPHRNDPHDQPTARDEPGVIDRLSDHLSERIVANVEPRSYVQDRFSVAADVALDKNRSRRQERPAREDAWRMYMGQPQEHGSFAPSPFTPSRSEDPDASYFAIPGFLDQVAQHGVIPSSGSNLSSEQRERVQFGDRREAVQGLVEMAKEAGGTARLVDNAAGAMGNFSVSLGEDGRGPYLAYYDKWDLDTVTPVLEKVGIATPFEIYDRIYYDPETFEPVTVDRQQDDPHDQPTPVDARTPDEAKQLQARREESEVRKLQDQMRLAGRDRVEGPSGTGDPNADAGKRMSEQSPVGATVAALGRGVGQIAEGVGGTLRMAGRFLDPAAFAEQTGMARFEDGPVESFTEPVGRPIAEAGKRLRETESLRATTATEEGGAFQPKNPMWWLERGVEVAPQMAAQVGLALSTGGAGAGAQLAAFALPSAVLEGGLAYNETLERTGDPNKAAEVSALTGAGAAALEHIPGAAILFNRIPGVRQAFRAGLIGRVGLASGAEGITESAQEAWSDAVNYAIGEDPEAFQDWQQRYKGAGAIGSLVGAGAGAVVPQQDPTEATPEPEPAGREPEPGVHVPEQPSNPFKSIAPGEGGDGAGMPEGRFPKNVDESGRADVRWGGGVRVESEAEPSNVAPPSDSEPAYEGGERVEVPFEEITLDPPRFQFKSGANEKGETKRSAIPAGATFDRENGSPFRVWRDPADGKTYLVDGHHRYNRFQEELQGTTVPVRYIEAETAEEVRMLGAQRNIARGRATKEDAERIRQEQEAQPAAGRRERTVFPGDGSKVETEYVLVDVGELTPSHDPFSFERQPEERFPAEIQGRAYHGERGRAARESVIQNTGRFDPDLALDETSSADGGVPTVTPEGIAVAGNQRIMMLQRLAKEHPDRYEAYLGALRERAERFGVDPAQVQPGKVLVRRIADESVDTSNLDQLRRLNAASDAPRGKTKDVLSEAATKADQFRSAGRALRHFESTVGEDQTIRAYLETAGGRGFLTELVRDGVFTEGERARYVDATTGTPTDEGKLVIERIMRSAAIGDPDVVGRAPASALRKLDSALPSIVQANQVEGWDISEALQEALDVLASARANGNTVTDQLGQGDLLGDGVSEEAASLARFLDGARKNDVTEAFRGYAEDAASFVRQSESEDLFGHEPKGPGEARSRFGHREGAMALEPDAGTSEESFRQHFEKAKPEHPIQLVDREPQTPLARTLMEEQDPDRFLELVYQDPAVAEADEESVQPGDPEDTWNIYNGWDAPTERQEQREDWLATLEQNNGWADPKEQRKNGHSGRVAQERQAILVMGPPASGKSTVANPILQHYRAMLIDSDEMKQLIPEFEGGTQAGTVHEESSQLNELLLARALARNDNVVVPLVGKGEESLQETIDLLKEEGYDVHLVINELPIVEAARRAWVRFHEKKRYVSFNYILGAVRDNPARNFQALKGRPEITSYQRFDNNVEREQKPVLLERSENAPALPGLPTEARSGRLGSRPPAAGRAQEGNGADQEGGAPREGRSPTRADREAEEGAEPGRLGFRPESEVGPGTPRSPQEGTFPRREGSEEEALEPDRDLFGAPIAPEGPAQGDLLGDQPARSLTDATAKAKQTVSLLAGKVQRGHASRAEREMYELARSLLRRNEKLDAGEVARQARETEEKRPTYGDNGDLFGLMPDADIERLWNNALFNPPGRPASVADVRAAFDEDGAFTPEGLSEGFGFGEVLVDELGYTREDKWGAPLRRPFPRMVGRYVPPDPATGRSVRDAVVEAFEGDREEGQLYQRAKAALRPRIRKDARDPEEAHPLEPGWSTAQLASERLPDSGRFSRSTAAAQAEDAGRFASREGTEAVPSRAQIQKELEEAFDIPVKTGGLGRRFKRAFGIYKSRPESVHLGTHGDIVTLAHEIGHHVQKLFFGSPDGKIYEDHLVLLPQEIQDELEDLGEGISGGGLREGWAEFWRRYIDNPEVLPDQSPALLRYIQERLDAEFPRIRDVLEQSARDWRLHREGSELARVQSQISVGESDPPMNLSDGWRKLRTAVLDQFEPIRQAVKQLSDGKPVDGEDAEMLARLVSGSTGIAEHMLDKAQISFAGEELGASLKEILEPVSGNLDNFRAYAVSRRALELHARNIESGIRKEDAEATVRQMEEHFGDSFKPAFDGLVKYQDNLLRYLVDAGVMSKRTFAAIKDKNKAYIPMMRVMDEQGASGGGFGMGHLFAPVKKIHGSGRQIIDPLESIVKATYEYAQLGAKQEVSQALAKLAERQGAAAQLEAVETPIRRVQFKLGEVEDQLARVVGQETLDEIRETAKAEFAEATAGLDENEIRARKLVPYDPAEELLAIFRPGDLFDKPNVISVLVDGDRRYYEVNPELYEALQGLGVEHAPLVARWLGIPARTLRAGATLAPEFQLRNPSRDQVMAAIQSEYGYTPYVDLFKGVAHILRKDETFWKWMASGGSRSSLLALDRKAMSRSVDELTRSDGVENVIKTEIDALALLGRATAELATLNLRKAAETSLEGVQKALDPLARLSALMEDATRVGEFANALEVEGDTKAGRQKAGSASREISIDFARHGSKTAAIRVMAAFWNARLQGYDRLARAVKKDPAKFAGKAFLYITLPSLIELAVNWEDEEYWDQPQWQRDLFWMFKVGDTWFRIPKPFELGLIFGTLPQRIAEMAFRDDPESVKKFLRETAPKEIEGLIPAPTAIMPLVENVVNYSFFLDRPIVPRAEQGIEARFQTGDHTSSAAEMIGRWTNTSPRKIDNLLHAYTGGLGRLGTQAIDRGAEAAGLRTPRESRGVAGIPGLRGITAREPGFGSESVERFYNRRAEATEALQTKRFLERENRREDLDELMEDEENRQKIRKVHVPGPAKGRYEIAAERLNTLRSRAERIRRDPTLSPAEKKEQIDELGREARDVARRALEP